MAFTKFVSTAPILLASSFIIFTKLSILPPTCTAIALAASFPEGNISPYKSSSSVSLSPGCIPARLAPASFITLSSGTVTSSERLPYFNARSAVITFVVLAGYILVVAAFEAKRLPSSFAIIAACADISPALTSSSLGSAKSFASGTICVSISRLDNL